MIDIHHHLLFDLDDGSRTLEMSIDMAAMALADGITHVVCTPHANERFPFRPELNRARLNALEEALLAKGIGPLVLGLGCDFHLMYENVEDALHAPTRYTINGRNYLLVEFPEYSISPNTSETLYDLRLSGMTPIITHPERNPILLKQPERMAEWLSTGALIERNWVHFIATDAHNLASRPPQMRTAYNTIAAKYGEETAQRLCVDNPRCAFEGLPLPAQPELLDLSKEVDPLRSESARKAGKTGFFGRLFSGNQ
jgi:protein-tyrosine phosphatase